MKHSISRTIGTAATAVAALTLAAACSSGGGTAQSAYSSAPTSSAPTASTTTPTTGASTGAPGALATTASQTLGTVIVDGQGRTLYRFDKDTNQPSASNCAGACATTWPPVPATTSVTGIAPDLIGSITRADGTTQLTVAGWPLYLFSGDKTPGDAKGEGVKGVWWAVAPDGSEVKPKA